MRIIAVEDHWPEYGTIVVRDTYGSDPASISLPGLPLLDEHAVNAQPGGTIAKAGDGWLQASARDARHHVRLEAQNGPPPLDDAWHDVVETPYHANTGAIMLTTVLSSNQYADKPLKLGMPGMYRVRISCRRTPPEIPGFEASQGDLWRMQFWATPGPPQPPQWLARSRPAVQPPACTGWRAVLGLACEEVLYAVQLAAATGEATGERIAAAYQPWSSSSGEWSSALSEDLSEYAAQLGVPAPTTRRELLWLLVAAGLVIAETSGEVTRYGLSTSPPHVEEVLRLPDEEVAMIRRQDAFHRYTSFAADLAAVAVWTPGSTVSATPGELSSQLLATEEEIHEAIRYGADRGLLSTSGEGTFTAMPNPPLQPEAGRIARM
ncbi:DUF6042 family protein [Nonomuraea sp. H19]|uniref:DUF6042 family protein n=1 Tax=Nonomuraea sp. H19 TaxID=3452206 RepID=UPI003F893966